MSSNKAMQKWAVWLKSEYLHLPMEISDFVCIIDIIGNISVEYHVSVDIGGICSRCRCDIVLTRSDLRNKQTYFDSLVWSPPHQGCLAGRLSSIHYCAHWTQICWIFVCGRFPGCEYLGFPGRPLRSPPLKLTHGICRRAFVITIIKLSELTALCLIGILPKHRGYDIDENWTVQYGSTKHVSISGIFLVETDINIYE